VAELAQLRPDWPACMRCSYGDSKQTCELFLGEPPEWAGEVSGESGGVGAMC
jgi:hypothetical protein